MTWIVALAIKPLVFLALFALPVFLLRRFAPACVVKRLLLFRIHDGERYTLRASWRQLLDKRS